MDKKQKQLGMNPSTASGRLVKDILFKFVKEAGHKCFICSGEMTRETFSVEHKTPWLDSEDPVKLFFDLENIAFSHKSCNIGAARRELAECGTPSAYYRGCRCQACRDSHAEYRRGKYTPTKRSERYKTKGQ